MSRFVHPMERQVMAKIWRRIVPLVVLVFFCSILDRINIAFAAVTMNGDLGLSNTAFGVAAGVFAIGYALFGVPSAVGVQHFGARRAVAVMMAAWGTCSAATAFVGSAQDLQLVRFLLGAAEAGLFPGMIYYLSLWMPQAHRGRVLAGTLLIQPVTLLAAGPLSSAVLMLDGQFDLAGWRWLFLAEAAPTFVLAIVVLFYLTDDPARARWLSRAEKNWLETHLNTKPAEREQQAAPRREGVRLAGLALVYFALGTAGIGAISFLPLTLRSIGYSNAETGWVAAAPAALAALCMPLWGYWTDRSQSREHVVAFACMTLGAGLLLCAITLPSQWALVGLVLAQVGFFGAAAPFWTLPNALKRIGAAASLALINLTGNLGNFAGPALVGVITDQVGGFGPGLGALGVIACVGGLLAATLARTQHARASAHPRAEVNQPEAHPGPQ